MAQIENGPWVTGQGDPSEAPYSPNGGASLTTFTPGGGPTNTIGVVSYPNLSVYPGSAHGGKRSSLHHRLRR
ncbi:MAG: hypothetical protein ACRDYC_12965 [Acidimicrobiales bacterium]